MRALPDLSLYLVIGPGDIPARSLDDVVRDAVRGGVTAVQLRRKEGSTRAFIEDARSLLALLRPIGIPLIINDRVDVALAVNADGVHVGQDDMDVEDARRLLGPDCLIGVSVTTLVQARHADGTSADYLGIGPVFTTATKPDAAPALGLAATAEICRGTRIPSVAIGGINQRNAADVRATGVCGLAVVSAICAAPNPAAAAAAFR